jgi:hypothetical protein
MKNNISITEERQFITREFADSMAGKTPPPYFRLHDPVQKRLVEYAASAEIQEQTGMCEYLERMIHFWREVSLAGLPRAGRATDECYALLFESAFDLAEAELTWAFQSLDQKSPSDLPTGALNKLASHTARGHISHADLVAAFTQIYAPMREADERYHNEFYIPFGGEVWFSVAILLAAEIDHNHALWPFRCALAQSSSNRWGDNQRLHARLIRESPQRALTTARAELMAHPILRIARLKYAEGSVEQTEVLRFLNAQCIKQGFESEEDYFGSDLTLGQWARDARQWAGNILDGEPEVCRELFHEAGEIALNRTRAFYHQHLGSDPADVDSLDATAALMKWANQRRGFQYSQYRAQRWEFVVDVVDAALWLGWLFPTDRSRDLNNSMRDYVEALDKPTE